MQPRHANKYAEGQTCSKAEAELVWICAEQPLMPGSACTLLGLAPYLIRVLIKTVHQKSLKPQQPQQI